MKKKSQIASEAFVYVLTIVIVGVILVMDYMYIGSSKNIMDRGELLQFKSKLASDMTSIGREYGTYKTKKEAEKRLRQIEFFKHLKSNPSLRRNLRKTYLLKK